MLPGMRARDHVRQRALVAAAVTSTLWPKLALACPACLGTSEKNALFLKVGSLFVLVPFLVVALVLYVLRQAPERDANVAARREILP